MSHTMTGCSFSDSPNNFNVGSNLMDYFEIGTKTGDSLWLQGVIVGSMDDVEYLFNARLFVPGNGNFGTIIDNFPKGPPPTGWVIRVAMDPAGSGKTIGYDLVSVSTGHLIFGYRVDGFVCTVSADLYDELGVCWAKADEYTLQLLRGPVRLGGRGPYDA